MDPRPALWQRLGRTRAPDDPLSEEVRLLAEFEQRADRLHTFEPLLVPGLLQTPAYARAALRLHHPASTLEQQIEARLSRQSLLNRADAPATRFLIDESVLLRCPGADPAVMAEQVDRLIDRADAPRADIRIVPFRSGLHEGVKGPLVVLEFDDPDEADLLYLEHAEGDTIRTGAEEVRPYAARFEQLAGLAVPVRDFLPR